MMVYGGVIDARNSDEVERRRDLYTVSASTARQKAVKAPHGGSSCRSSTMKMNRLAPGRESTLRFWLVGCRSGRQAILVGPVLDHLSGYDFVGQ
jgi:hypothetical protein